MSSLKNNRALETVKTQLRLISGINWILVPALIFAIPFIIFFEQGDIAFKQSWAFKVIETFSPFVGILIGSNIFSREWELQTNEIWLSKANSRGCIYWSRLLLIYSYIFSLASLELLVICLFYVRMDYLEGLSVILPPAIFLSNLGFISGLVSKNTVVAYLVPSLYWFMEISTKGKYTGIFYLFPRGSLACADACSVISTSNNWKESKLAVLFIGVCLMLIGWIILEKYEFIKKR